MPARSARDPAVNLVMPARRRAGQLCDQRPGTVLYAQSSGLWPRLRDRVGAQMVACHSVTCEPSALLAADSLRFLLFGKLNVEERTSPGARSPELCGPTQSNQAYLAATRRRSLGKRTSQYCIKSRSANENPKKRRATGDSRDTTNCLCSDLTPYLELSPQLTLSTQNLMAVLQISQAGESCLVLPNSFVPFVRGDGTSASSWAMPSSRSHVPR